MRTPVEMTELFRARGLKVTPQRQCIFRILHGNPHHPTAESVHAAAAAEMPTISLKTVYQTLNELADLGELSALDLGTGSTRFDPTIGAHHHLVCTGCGKVRDVFVEPRGVAVPVEQLGGFDIAEPEITWRGTCPECKRTKGREHADG